MESSKAEHIKRIRSNTAYPTYRGVIDILARLGYIVVGFQALAFLITGFSMMGRTVLGGLVLLLVGALSLALSIVIIRFLKEGALILADIGDSITEQNSKNSNP